MESRLKNNQRHYESLLRGIKEQEQPLSVLEKQSAHFSTPPPREGIDEKVLVNLQNHLFLYCGKNSKENIKKIKERFLFTNKEKEKLATSLSQ